MECIHTHKRLCKSNTHHIMQTKITTHKLMLVFMTVTHHRKPNFHQKKKFFCAVEGDSTATHTSHLHQLANTALKAVCHSVIFTRAATKCEAVRIMICYPLHQSKARIIPSLQKSSTESIQSLSTVPQVFLFPHNNFCTKIITLWTVCLWPPCTVISDPHFRERFGEGSLAFEHSSHLFPPTPGLFKVDRLVSHWQR